MNYHYTNCVGPARIQLAQVQSDIPYAVASTPEFEYILGSLHRRVIMKSPIESNGRTKKWTAAFTD